MKVYDIPAEVPFGEPDYANYDTDRELAREREHEAALKAWLKANGFPGKNTGETVSFPVADGYARYMLAEGKKACLIHLPYGDAWNYRDVEFLPKREILKRIEHERRIAALFAARKVTA